MQELFSGLGISIFAGLFGIQWIGRILINDSLHQKLNERTNWVSFSFLLLWTIAGFFTLIQGIRFIMILIPPLVISTGFMIGISIEYLKLFKKSNRLPVLRKPALITFLAILIILVPLFSGTLTVQKDNKSSPRTNDDIWSASLWIKNDTNNNTVIISDWSNGHVYTAIADRPVVEGGRMGYIETLSVRNYDDLYPFEEKSPSTSRDYWICKAFSTDNESLSMGISRMLSTTGDEGYIKLNMCIKNTTKTVEITNNILGLKRSDDKVLLINKYLLENDQAESF